MGVEATREREREEHCVFSERERERESRTVCLSIEYFVRYALLFDEEESGAGSGPEFILRSGVGTLKPPATSR